MKTTAEMMTAVAEDLMGTCQSLDTVLEEQGLSMDMMTTEMLSMIDEHTMECQECNWWCEPCELNDDQICDDCGG